MGLVHVGVHDGCRQRVAVNIDLAIKRGIATGLQGLFGAINEKAEGEQAAFDTEQKDAAKGDTAKGRAGSWKSAEQHTQQAEAEDSGI